MPLTLSKTLLNIKFPISSILLYLKQTSYINIFVTKYKLLFWTSSTPLHSSKCYFLHWHVLFTIWLRRLSFILNYPSLVRSEDHDIPPILYVVRDSGIHSLSILSWLPNSQTAVLSTAKKSQSPPFIDTHCLPQPPAMWKALLPFHWKQSSHWALPKRTKEAVYPLAWLHCHPHWAPVWHLFPHHWLNSPLHCNSYWAKQLCLAVLLWPSNPEV